MSNINLFQFSTKDVFENTQYVKISKLLCEKYCELHNFDYEFKVIDNINDREEILLKKILIIYDKLKSLNKNDYLVFLDTDVFINLPDFNLTSYIEEPYQIYFAVDSIYSSNKTLLSVISDIFKNKYTENISLYTFLKNETGIGWNLFNELSLVIQNPYGLNSGFIIIQKTDKMLELFEDAISVSKLNHMKHTFSSGDQNILSNLLLNDYYFDSFKILPKFTQGNPLINPKIGLSFYSNETFLLHLYGQPDNIRDESANIILNKWKKLNLIKDENIIKYRTPMIGGRFGNILYRIIK